MSTIEERVAALESALASMTAAEKRIVELPAASSVANDDFVALDGVANGSRRFAASNLGGKAEVMTEAEWDDLPDSKLTDGKVYALSGVSPSTQDNPLWQKLGFAALDTQADDCSDAINELNTGLTTLNSNLTPDVDTITMGNISGYIMRMGKLRILHLYALDMQTATTKQLASKDYPDRTYTVRAWLLKADNPQSYGTVKFEINGNGVLSTDSTIVRGGCVFPYFAAN